VVTEAVDLFLSALGPAVPVTRLEARRVLEGAIERWPTVQLDAAAFGRFVSERLPENAASLGLLHLDDLLLAWACLAGQPAGLAAFEAGFGPLVRQVCARAASPAEVAAEVEQHLLVGDGRRAALAGYAGLGPLASYVSVAAMRVVLNAQKRASRQPQLLDDAAWSELAMRLSDGKSPEATLESSELRPHLRAVLEAALEGLTVRQRSLLRLHYGEGVSADALGRIYGVHRATSTRWLADARAQVFVQVQQALRQRLSLGPETLESVNRHLANGLDFTLSGLGTR
jgi:RNA polymerase sigma-70 factor